MGNICGPDEEPEDLKIIASNEENKTVTLVGYEALEKQDKSQKIHTLNLNFREKKYEDDIAIKIGQQLQLFTVLSSLDIDCYINNFTELSEMMKGIIQQKSLTSLKLTFARNDNLGKKGIQLLTENIQNFPKVKNFECHLSWSYVTDEQVTNLMAQIGAHLNVEYYNMSCARLDISEAGAQSIWENISKWPKLTAIRTKFSRTKIGNKGLENIAKQVGKMTNLKDFDLEVQDVKATGETFNILINEVMKLSKLESLAIQFAGNQLEQTNMDYLCKNLVKSQKLKSLSIGLPHISNEDNDEAVIKQFNDSFKPTISDIKIVLPKKK